MDLETRIEESLPEAYAIARAVTASEEEAEDAVGSAVVAVLSHPDRLDPSRPFLPYFARVVVNSARGLHRSARRRKAREEIAMVRAPETADGSGIEGRETAAAVRTALEALPVDERAAVLITHLSGLSQVDAGEILGLPTRTVSRRVGRALEKLRKMLTRAGFAGLALPALLTETIRRPVPGRLSARVHELSRSTQAAAPTSPASAATAKGGMAMKLIAGVLAASAVAAAVAVVSGGGGAPLPAEAPKGKHKDFEYTTIGNGKIFIEHAAMSGAFGHLDGPARGGMARKLFGATADAAGNLYLYDHDTMTIRAVRKRDRRLFTLAGGRYHNMGTPTAREGPADQLRLFSKCFIAMPGLAAVGDPMNGDGSLYVVDDTRVLVRLWRNKEKGGIWWYECIAGLGKTPATNGATAVETRLSSAQVVSTPRGEVGLITGNKRSAALYWLREGKLVAAYDQAFVEKQAGATFYCRGIDVEGNFVGSTGAYTQAKPFLIVVSADGKSVKKLPTPYPPQWTVCADQKKPGRYFFRACDDYSIQYVNAAGKSLRLLRDGSWKLLTENIGNRGFREGLNWSRGNTLPDGRYLGYTTSAASHVFTMTFLDEGRQP